MLSNISGFTRSGILVAVIFQDIPLQYAPFSDGTLSAQVWRLQLKARDRDLRLANDARRRLLYSEGKCLDTTGKLDYLATLL